MVDPRARELAEKLVTILNTTTDSHAVIVALDLIVDEIEKALP